MEKKIEHNIENVVKIIKRKIDICNSIIDYYTREGDNVEASKISYKKVGLQIALYLLTEVDYFEENYNDLLERELLDNASR